MMNRWDDNEESEHSRPVLDRLAKSIALLDGNKVLLAWFLMS